MGGSPGAGTSLNLTVLGVVSSAVSWMVLALAGIYAVSVVCFGLRTSAVTRGRRLGGVEVAELAEGDEIARALGGGLTEDDVVQDFNFEELASADEVARYFDVGFRWCGV